ncbi:SHOCT domain-containing protein [Candidatus Pelagibacter sp.]|jgi:predicted PurR-regulated permease PerM|uniref:SHOCT domain-containing protein n=1 Tax=Candidatus Pelagibacter sp. TaxID=2024849 RepID=UPI0031294AA5
MEKLIFFILAVPILIFVFYLGGSAIMTGFKAKVDNAPNKENEPNTDNINDNLENNSNLSAEITKLNELLKSGVLTQEEFDKAKKKLLDN